MSQGTDWGLIFDALLSGVWTTVQLTAVAFAVALVAGFPVALMRVSRIAPLRWIGTAFVEIVRGIPVVAWLLLVFYGLVNLTDSDPMLTAMVALSVVATAYVAENYRAALLAVPLGQWEAAQALGLTRRQLFWRIIAPQGVSLALPASATYAIGLLKESSFASVIGASDVAYQAMVLHNGGNGGLPVFLVAGLIYLLLSLPIAVCARWVDSAVRKRSAV